MFVRRIAIENVRSFLDRAEMRFEGPITIMIGPNGGGKTNLLDTLVIVLKRYLFARRTLTEVNFGNGPRWMLQESGHLQSMEMPRHSLGADRAQVVEIDLELTQPDLDSMRRLRADAGEIRSKLNKPWQSDPWEPVSGWKLEDLAAGQIFTFIWRDGTIVPPQDKPTADFFSFVQLFEFDNESRAELGLDTLKLPMLFLPTHRGGTTFQSSIALPNFNEPAQRQQADTTTSKAGGAPITLAIGRMAREYRLLQEDDNVDARARFRDDKARRDLTQVLDSLGYSWELKATNVLTNEFSVVLTKQGSSFAVNAASSGEKEILTYLFAIYALNIRDALIIVDEPELHLHPRWQLTLLGLFETLAKTTGNQFILATHSPTFVAPTTVRYVSRVYSKNQKSDVVRLDAAGLPNAKHRFNLINSHNNERIFFTDKVLLVEGLQDRIVFEALLQEMHAAAGRSGQPALEVVSVGGKGLFPAYEALLQACRIEYRTIADLDYVEQVGPADLKTLFRLNAREIKRDVLENVSSLDADSLVAQIEAALASGSWDDARGVWDYIKSRRRMLKPNLKSEEQQRLDTFLAQKRRDGLYILKQGTLEAYLPKGYRDKDTEKLVDLVTKGGLFDRLDHRAEIEDILRDVLNIRKQGVRSPE